MRSAEASYEKWENLRFGGPVDWKTHTETIKPPIPKHYAPADLIYPEYSMTVPPGNRMVALSGVRMRWTRHTRHP